MAKLPTIDEMAKEVAHKAMQEINANTKINGIPLAEFLVKVNGVAEFLKSEIRICDERLSEEPNPNYDGVNVGFTNSTELNINHIRFCKKLLGMMNFE